MGRSFDVNRDEASFCELNLEELDSLLLDFDPVQDWIVDPDQLIMSGDETKGRDFAGLVQKVAGLDVFSDSAAALGSESEIMYSSVELDGKDGVFVDADCRPVSEGLESLDFLVFDQKKVEEESSCGPCGPLVEKNAESGSNDEILSSSVVEKMKDVCLTGNTLPSSILLPDDAACKGDENAKTDTVDFSFENQLVSESIKHDCKPDEESSGSESKELEEDTSSDDEDSSSSSYLSSNESSDDEEEDEDSEENGEDQLDSCAKKQLQVAENVEMEDGEIKDDNIADLASGSDEEVRGPIRSKNEIEALPPVPKVEVSLEQHHQTLPVGVVLSMLDNRVVVEGSENHNPLNEGSILWLTESRKPLGFIDEIFGPVKNPYYIVRFNHDEEIPGEIIEGCAVSFVQEFASYVLNQKDLYKKGYDASGDNDEELEDELEFSDDEKEALYKQSQRQVKRGNSERDHQSSKSSTRKKTNNRNSVRNKSIFPAGNASTQQQSSVLSGPSPQLVAAGNFTSFRAENAPSNGNAMEPSFNVASQNNNCFGTLPQQQLNALWLNGFPHQQQQHPAVQELVMNILSSQQHQNQFNIPNRMPFQQPIIPGFQPPANTPWPGGLMLPSVPSTPFGFQPPVNSPLFAGNFGLVPFGSNSMPEQGISASPDQQIPRTRGPRPPMPTNQGRPPFRGGRRPQHRGGRHSFGGRGGRAGNF